MNLKKETKKLSHILIYADKNLPQEGVWAFCTNVTCENPEIRSDHLCYDNLSGNETGPLFDKYLQLFKEDGSSVFLISDSEEAVMQAGKYCVASAALLTDNNRDRSFGQVLYCIEDIGFMDLARIERMWMRYHNIPWTITATDRLVIREQTLDDIDALYDVYSDSEAARYTEDLYEDRLQEEEYLRQYIDNQYRFYEYGIWALTLKKDGTFIGRAGISLRKGYDLPEIGFIIGSPYRRMGYAKEAVKAIMEYGRAELGFDEYMAFTRPQNKAAVGLLTSLGFTCTGYTLISGYDHGMYTCRMGGQPLTKQQ